jgi:hypothetical protein
MAVEYKALQRRKDRAALNTAPTGNPLEHPIHSPPHHPQVSNLAAQPQQPHHPQVPDQVVQTEMSHHVPGPTVQPQLARHVPDQTAQPRQTTHPQAPSLLAQPQPVRGELAPLPEETPEEQTTPGTGSGLNEEPYRGEQQLVQQPIPRSYVQPIQSPQNDIPSHPQQRRTLQNKPTAAPSNQRPQTTTRPPQPAPTAIISEAPPLPAAIVNGLPSLHEIFSTNINVVKTVHHTIRGEVMDLFSSLLRGCANGTETSFKLLFMFTKSILGKVGEADPPSALIRQRISSWHMKGQIELWEAVRKNRKSTKEHSTPQVRKPAAIEGKSTTQSQAAARPPIRKAMHLVTEGEYSKAIQTLLSVGTVPKDEDAATKLRALHPESPEPVMEAAALVDLADTVEISERHLINAVKSFSSSTSTGVLGIKIPLLKQLLHYDISGTFTRALRTFAITCANGKVPVSVRPFLTGASLTGIPKQPNGIRPIAAGEILRRIIAKSVLAQVMSQAAGVFGDFQLGVGRKGGIENIAFACQTIIAQNVNNPDFVGFKVDVKNAFNALLRAKMMLAAKRFPVLGHWLAVCYGAHSHLWFGDFVLSSQNGVQQGDPLGPLLFALTLLDTIKEIEALHPLLNKWYLDDGVIFGTHATIAKVIEILEGPSLRNIGLELNPSKCELIWLDPKFVRHDAFPPHYTNRITDGNFVIVGAPIGSPAHVDQHIRKVTSDAEKVWSQLGELQDVQAAYTLFRACATWNRVAHLMRTTDPAVGGKAFRDFDIKLRTAFTGLTSLHMDHAQWTQLTLPTRKGGAGLRSAEHHSPAAFLAASLFYASETRTPLSRIPGTALAVRLVNERIRCAPLDLLSPLMSQKYISDQIDDKTFDALFFQAYPHDKARLGLVSRWGAGEWLNVVPADRLGTKMYSAEFLVAIKRWIGQPVMTADHRCPKCGEGCDESGDHALQCGSGACKYRRHNDLRDMLFRAAQSSGLRPQLEPTNLCTNESRPADFLTTEGPDKICNDVFVIHPFAPTHLKATLADPGSATEDYARKVKHGGFDKLPLSKTHQLRALGVDTFGGWNNEATTFLKSLAKSDAARHNSGITEASRCLTRRLNFCIIRHCARAILYRSPQLPSHPLDQRVTDKDNNNGQAPEQRRLMPAPTSNQSSQSNSAIATGSDARDKTQGPIPSTAPTAPQSNQSSQSTVLAEREGTPLNPKTTTHAESEPRSSNHTIPLPHPTTASKSSPAPRPPRSDITRRESVSAPGVSGCRPFDNDDETTTSYVFRAETKKETRKQASDVEERPTDDIVGGR